MKVRATGPLGAKAAPPNGGPPKVAVPDSGAPTGAAPIAPPSKRFFKPKDHEGSGPSSGGAVNPQIPPVALPPKSSPKKDGGGRGRGSSVGSGG